MVIDGLVCDSGDYRGLVAAHRVTIDLTSASESLFLLNQLHDLSTV